MPAKHSPCHFLLCSIMWCLSYPESLWVIEDMDTEKQVREFRAYSVTDIDKLCLNWNIGEHWKAK